MSLGPGVHWRALDPDIHLGYRKGKRGGRWLVRWYAGSQQYRQETLGTADDCVAEGNLSFEAAAKLARAKVIEQRCGGRGAPGLSKITVSDAVDSYVKVRDARATARAG